MKKLILITFSLLAAADFAAAAHGEVHERSTLIPFVFTLINFFILLFLLYRLALPRLKTFFAERSQNIRRTLRDSEQAMAAEEKKLEGYEERIRALEKEVAELRTAAEQGAKDEETKIIREAEREAETIKRQAQNIAQQEVKKARLELQRDVAALSVEAAGRFVKNSISEKDQARLINDYMKHLSLES